jgi:hypothetical protein
MLSATSNQLSATSPDAPPHPSTAIPYVVPSAAANETLLWFPPPASSLLATNVNASTDEPTYTASNVSKLLPKVSMVTAPEPGAVHDHHTEAPPADPAWLGSPISFVAPTLEPLNEPPTPDIVTASAKSSFAGPTGSNANDAVTDRACVINTEHVLPVHEHAPDQPAKVLPPAAVAVSVTLVPSMKSAAHALPQSMPAGTLVTEPEPSPSRDTLSARVGTDSTVTSTSAAFEASSALVAVTTVDPTPTARNRPLLLTVATSSSSLDHTTLFDTPSRVTMTSAVRFTDSPKVNT